MTPFVPAYLGRRYRAEGPKPDLAPTQAAVRDRLLAEDRPEDWETCDCLCGASGGHVLTEVDRYGLSYRKVLCTACGLLRVTPRWTMERFGRFYADSYRDLYAPMGERANIGRVTRLAQGPSARMIGAFVEDAWRKFGDRNLAKPTIVEVGTGGGWNLATLPEHWHRVGYDSDERYLQLGREAFGIEMRKGFLAEALPYLAEADCVLLSHVLEHVHDPVSTLAQLCAAVRPDTLILIEVPGIFRLHKTSLDPMRYWQNAHTYTFCAKTVADTCRRAGLEPLFVDEWVRLVLQPKTIALPLRNDPQLAAAIGKYLRYCELSYRLSQTCGRVPLVGSVLARVARRVADGTMRIGSTLGAIHGIQRHPGAAQK